jgi:hypothetical protein
MRFSILKKDHESVKELFEKFENSESAAGKEQIVTKAVAELKIHASIEEEIFYPTVRKHVGADTMNDADEEHHVARVPIAELDLNGGGFPRRSGRGVVLAAQKTARETAAAHSRTIKSGSAPASR